MQYPFRSSLNLSESAEGGLAARPTHRFCRVRVFARERLLASAEQLRSAGILHASIFGSVARGEATSDSDVDILLDLDPNAHIGLFKFGGLQQMLEAIMVREVDLIWNGPPL